MMNGRVDYERLSVFEQIREGLKQSIAHGRGELTLRTTIRATPPPRLTSRRVVAIRRKTGMSQSVFASYLNVPTRTLQSWEQGARTPKAGEARLLQLVEAAPEEFRALVERAVRPAVRRRGKRGRAAA